MSTDAAAQPLPTIIKKKKKGGGEEGHHGGAWKVAYADFVTAMMAFFLLMWLLNATTEEQRKGIADYFNPTIPISRISGGGSDGLNGSSIFTEETYARMGTGAAQNSTIQAPQNTEGDNSATIDQKLEAGLQSLKQRLDEGSERLSEHLQVKMSPEGIVLELVDSDTAPLFRIGRSEPTDLLTNLLAQVTRSFGTFENNIKIVGHTDSRRYRNHKVYDNWNLSSDRANIARRLLVRYGIEAERIKEVSGKADTDPLVLDDTKAAQNRRISITLLKH